MFEGAHGSALVGSQARGAEVSLRNGASNGEDPDLKH